MLAVSASVKKYISIYILLIKSCLSAQMEYRLNFFISMAVEAGFLLTKLLYVLVVYNTGIQINGYSPDAILLYVGTFSIITAVYTGVFMVNFYQIPKLINTGTLDILITKPISLQFLVSTRQVNLSMPIPNFVGGAVMVYIAWSRLGLDYDFYTLFLYVLFILSGIVMAYAVFLIPQLLAFWIVKTDALFEIADRAWDFNTMPMVIYTKWIQRFGVFLLPIFAISNFPNLFLLDRLPPVYVLWAVAGPLLFVAVARWLWKLSVKSYSSASS